MPTDTRGPKGSRSQAQSLAEDTHASPLLAATSSGTFAPTIWTGAEITGALAATSTREAKSGVSGTVSKPKWAGSNPELVKARTFRPLASNLASYPDCDEMITSLD